MIKYEFHQCILSTTLLLWIAIATPEGCIGRDIDLPKAGLTISLSDQWSQVPESELTAMVQQARAQAPRIKTPNYAYGFRKVSGDSWGSLLINVRPRQITSTALEAMPKAESVSEYSKTTEQKSSGLLQGFKMGESRYDSKRQILWMTMSAADVMGGGGMKGVSATFIREKDEVQLSGYCDVASYMFFCDVFEGIICSATQSLTKP